MAIIIPDGFSVTAGVPIDSRTNVANAAARDALDEVTLYVGLLCYVQDEDAFYKWDGSAWVDADFGGGSGIGTVDTLDAETFDKLDDFTGFWSPTASLTFETTDPLHGEQSLRFDHSENQSITKIIPVPPVFRGKKCVIELKAFGTAFGNCTLGVSDETNLTQIFFGELIEVSSSTVNKTSIEFELPQDCESLSWRIAGTTGSSVYTLVDDVVIRLADRLPNMVDVKPVIGDRTVDETDDVLLVDCSFLNADVIITLPAANSYRKLLRIKKIDNTDYTVTVTADGAETIDGETTYVIYRQYDSISIVSDLFSGWSIL